MNTPEPHKDIQDIIKEIPPSSIPLVRQEAHTPPALPDINNINQQIWGAQSNSLITDYTFGQNYAYFGENELNTQRFFRRFAQAFISIISNEYQKRGIGSEDLSQYYNILTSCMVLISKEIDKKGLKDFNILSVVSALHGFISNYNTIKEKT